jgi:hypothetical protein
MPIKTGATVRQIQPAPITGQVIERRLNDSQDQLEYHVESPDSDGDGQPQRRWFLERDIEQLPGDAS